MKCVILAGGKGSRIRYYEDDCPKPLINVGSKPILWHIIKTYAHYGIRDFIICLGYKADNFIKYFNDIDVKKEFGEDVKIQLINTGLETLTGSRLKKVANLLNTDESFLLTYGDGVAKIDIEDLIKFHKSKDVDATISVVPYVDRFGIVEADSDIATAFNEKKEHDDKWINIGYMILNYTTLDKISYNDSILEKDLLEKVCSEGKLSIYKNVDFWKCLDTPRDLQELNNLIDTNNAKWVVW